MFVSETYGIEDCYWYSSTFPSYTVETIGGDYKKWNLNSAIDLPSNFEISFTGKFTSSSNMMCCMMIGESTSDYYYSGIDSTGLINCISRNNSRAVLNRNQVGKSRNTEYPLRITWNGTTFTLYNGTSEYISHTNSEYSKSKFLGMVLGASAEMKNIKVKPL